jgi:two-component system nitrate/nitrite sensor histidine kinase NarX
MKLETARLRTMLDRGFETSRVEGAISDLQEGLNAAYKHLRELLVTFRVKLDAPNLHAALEHAVIEFNQQTSARVSLDYALKGYAQRPNDDIHVLHILREALNNAIKHSQAEQITLHCRHDEAGDIVFCVDDDGIGLPDEPEKEHHYGLYTMRERARQLNGVLSLSRPPSGGTRVELRIPRVTALMHA